MSSGVGRAYGPMDDAVVVITGGSDGIGLASAIALARAGANIVLVSRDPERTAAASRRVTEASGRSVDTVVADFGDFAAVRRAGADIAQRHPRIDVLANNAGAIYSERSLTVDGNERTLQVDYLSPFLFTQLLRPSLVAGGARIINVSSGAHMAAWRGIHYADPGFERGWGSFRAYAQAKLGNILFSNELARRWGSSGVTSNAMHPGVVRSGFYDEWTGAQASLMAPFVSRFLSPEQGADSLVWLASSPDAATVTGTYVYRRRPRRLMWYARDAEAERALWEWTVATLELEGEPVAEALL